MKEVVWTDKNGYLRRSLVRDDDEASMAEYGLPAGPPDLEQIDWEMMKKAINNAFVEAGINNYIDLQRTNGMVIATNIFKRYIVSLFREQASIEKQARKVK